MLRSGELGPLDPELLSPEVLQAFRSFLLDSKNEFGIH